MEGSYRNLKRNSLRKLQHESLSPEVADSEVSYFISRLYFDKLRTNPSLRGGEVRAPSLRAKKNQNNAVSKPTCTFWTCDIRGSTHDYPVYLMQRVAYLHILPQWSITQRNRSDQMKSGQHSYRN